MLRSVYKKLLAGTNNLTHQIGNQELWLLAANLEVADSAGNPTRNAAGNIYVQAINEANAFSLAVGNLRNGCIQGFGCIPLLRGYEIKAEVYHATADEVAKLNIMVLTTQEAKALGIPLAPNWMQRTDALPTHGLGKPTLVYTAGAAAATSVNLRPSDGYLWEVSVAWAGHDDNGNNPTITWSLEDGTNSVNFLTSNAANLNTPIAIGQFNVTQRPPTYYRLILSYDVYAKATYSVMGAGKIPFVTGLVREYCE